MRFAIVLTSLMAAFVSSSVLDIPQVIDLYGRQDKSSSSASVSTVTSTTTAQTSSSANPMTSSPSNLTVQGGSGDAGGGTSAGTSDAGRSFDTNMMLVVTIAGMISVGTLMVGDRGQHA
ncbi:hypothetical protein NA57DRAFT_51437 [Rhizodiscina lignyota]|uniref:Uncharacterized protein n=1 Tax=Rhizodiscina lignyota TaxID=1504668 RepID=A0A9P4MGL4_9PEZI|nr:hypothetical protein NA57DRAFT_51437 [Rhizodiscina lignyota]